MNVMLTNVNALTRFAFYAFIIAIPFETASTEFVSIVGTIPMLMGIAFVGVALLQPRICFTPPPGAFWCFAGYVFVYVILGITQNPMYAGPMLQRLLTLIQMLVLMCVSYSLFKYPEICKGALLAFVASCTIVSMLQIFGVETVAKGQGRSSVFADNPNSVGATLSLGLIALVGIVYARIKVDKRMALLAWTLFPVIGIALVMTGSRGALLGLVSGLALLIIKDGRLGTKLKVGLVAVLAIGFLVWASYTNEAMRTRLEHTLYGGDVAQRDNIIPQAWAMFLEKPVLGWGPVSHHVELGYRRGESSRDTHNLYLWVLTETGLLGSIPFLAGLWLTLRAAWRARSGREGSLPMAMVVCLLIVNMSATWHNRKLFWLTIAYVLASAWSFLQVSQHQSARFSDPLDSRGAGTFPSCSQAVEGLTGPTSARPQEPS
jgi:O-antigen ligase